MKAPAGDELEEEQRLLASAVRADDRLAALEREAVKEREEGREDSSRPKGHSTATRSSRGR